MLVFVSLHWLSKLVCCYSKLCTAIMLLRNSIFTHESSMGSMDIIERKWLCLATYYILNKLHTLVGIISVLLLPQHAKCLHGYQYFFPQKCSNRANMSQLFLLRFNHYMPKHFSEVLAPSNHLWWLSSLPKVLEEICQISCRWAFSPQQHSNVFGCAKYLERYFHWLFVGDSQKLLQSRQLKDEIRAWI